VSQGSDQLDAPPPADAPPPGPARKKASLAELLAELKRRRVFRVMAGYGIFAFAVLQVIEPIMHGAHLGDWVLTAALVALAVGFPVAVILSWVFDFTAEGLVRTPRVTGGPRLSRGRVAALLVGIGMLAALPGLGWYAWKQGKEAAPAAGTASIAVLPFADLSPNHDQDYFSDGVAEEILDALSRVEGLRVPGRASCFWFKGKNAEASEIASKLGVAHLLQGSVRRAGKKLRITAELTRVAGGERVWSQTFNREEADVLAVQDEIAQAVVEALKVKLLPGQAAAAARRPPVPEAYDEYLLGRQLLGQFSIDAQRRAVAPLERATQLDPQFAQAWATLAIALKYQAEQSPLPAAALDGKRRALVAAERSIALAPEAAEGYVARALLPDARGWAWSEALTDARRAVELNPQSADAHRAVGMTLATLGRVGEGLLELQRATELEPLSSWMWNGYGWLALCDGKYELARRALSRALEINPANQSSPGNLLTIKLLEGRAADVLAEVGRMTEEAERLAFTAMATHSLGRAQESQVAVARLEAGFGERWAQLVADVHAWRGERALAIVSLERARDRLGGSVDEATYDPVLRALRDYPAFMAFLATINLAPGSRGAAVAVTPADAPSIAVLPFSDMSEKHDQEYFADGVAEEIINALAHLEGLKVIGRTSSFSFKGKREDLRAIGQALGVQSILEGSLRREGDQVRINAQLIRVADGSQLWSERYERKLTGIFKVQDEIARAVVAALKVRLLSGAPAHPPAARSTNPEAYGLYLLGRQLATRDTLGDIGQAVGALEGAIAIDPEYAPAQAWLGFATYSRGQIEAAAAPAANVAALARVDRAIGLAPDLADGYVVRGLLRNFVTWDWAGADADLARALRLAPGDVTAQTYKARLLATLGRLPEALRQAQRALEVDPLSVVTIRALGDFQAAAGQLAAAESTFRRGLALSPAHARLLRGLGFTMLLAGRNQEALELFERHPVPWIRLVGLSMAHQGLGHDTESRRALEALVAQAGDSFAYQAAEAYAWRGEPDQAFESFERAVKVHDSGLAYLKFDPLLARLRGDPRYRQLLQKLKLPLD
jgi:serine/threonine-protein kinase